MIVLLFSNSPFMAGSIPQSSEAQQVSALLDPFGLSAYFLESRELTAQQKNIQMVPLTGYLLLNRVLYLLLSGGLFLLSARLFSFSNTSGKKIKKSGEKYRQDLWIFHQNIQSLSPISDRKHPIGLCCLCKN
jgi:hypothetical protein